MTADGAPTEAGAAEAAIRSRGLWRPFGSGGRSIHYSDFEVPRGGIVALVGLSGVGKTTLLNMLSGVDRATFEGDDPRLELWLREGRVNVGGGEPYPHGRVSIIFQRGYLLGNASVGLNLAIPATLAARDAEQAAIDAHLDRVGLNESYRIQRPWQISGGEAQRVGIARALLRDPDVIFADEPTSNLDQEAAERVMTQIQAWVRGAPHRTVVWVSHDLELVARYADHVLVMSRLAPEPGDAPGQRRVGIELRPRPRSTSELHNWKYETVLEGGQPPVPDEPPPLPEHSPRRGRIAWRLALSEMFSRRSSFREADTSSFHEVLHRTTSDWAPLRPKGGEWRLARAYAPFNVLLITFLALMLAAAMAVALKLNVDKLSASLDDPRNCHVVITGGVDGDGLPIALTDASIKQLEARPWRGDIAPGALIEPPPDGEEWARASCRDGVAAFGRRDFGRGFVSLPRDGQCTGRGAIPLQMMVGTPNEPILEHAVLTAAYAEGARAGQSILDLSRSPVAGPDGVVPLRFYFGNRDIFLSEYAVSELEKAGGLGEDREVCLEYQGRMETFSVAGVVDSFEAPRRTRYEAFILDRALKRMLGDTALAQNFSEAQVYFDPDHLATARAWLDANNWRYVGDTLDRTSGLIAASVNGLLILGTIAVANIVLFLAISYYVASSYLAKNGQSFAVLQSFGLRWGTAARQSGIEMTLTILIAALPLTLVPAALALTGPVDLGDFGTVGWRETAVILAGVTALFTVFAWAAAIWATRRWWRQNAYRSEMIA